MSLNQILAIAQSLDIVDQRFVGQTISRNQHIYTAEIATVVPFQFVMRPHQYLPYSKNRALLSDLRIADKSLEQVLNFTSTGWAHLIAYQGDLAPSQLAPITATAASSNKTIVINNIPASVVATQEVVRAGDYIQIGRYTYIVTADVPRGTSPALSIPIHRSLLTTVADGTDLVFGQYGTATISGNSYTGITFPVVLRDYPNPIFVPSVTNDSFINWSGDFKAFEYVLAS